MYNELLFFASAIVDILFIFWAARRGKDWLFSTVVVNLILVSIFGAKLITVFGFTTNAGNVFYACVFLAAHFIIEHFGKRDAMKTIWFGVIFILFFILMTQFSSHFIGLSLSDEANDSMSRLFSLSVRVTFASIIAYVFAQHVNISIYEWLKIRTRGKFLWLRSNVANIASQLVDSLLFFSIAFFDLPGPILVQTILVGWLIKTAVVSIGTPFVYASIYLEKMLSKKT